MHNATNLIMQALESAISHSAVSLPVCDLSHDMAGPSKHDYYAALVEIMPEGMTEASWARAAKISSSFFQDLKKKGSTPRHDTLVKLLAVAQTSMSRFNEVAGIEVAPVADNNAREADGTLFRHRSNPMDVPVWGSAEGAEYCPDLDEPGTCVETTALMPDEIIDHIRRPIGIAEKRNVYALFVVGTSMEPRYMDGEPIFVDPGRNPAIGDHVVLQLVAPDGDGGDRIVRAMVKKLERRTADYYVLAQYEPRMTFKVAKTNVAAMHRVIPPNELHGI